MSDLDQIIRRNRDSLIGELAKANAEIERLRTALSQIHDACIDNATPSCDHAMALKFVRDVALKAIELSSLTRR